MVSWKLLLMAPPMGSVASSCLPDAISAEQRIDILMNGTSRPFTLYEFAWPSAQIFTELVRILASEKLGYNTIHRGTSPVPGGDPRTPAAFPALMGCKLPWDFSSGFFAICEAGPMEESVAHAAFEIWTNYQPFVAHLERALPERWPEIPGTVGFDADEGIYFKEADALAAESVGKDLSWFSSWNASWHQPHVYFENRSALPSPIPCEALDEMIFWKMWSDTSGSHLQCIDGWLTWELCADRTPPLENCVPLIFNAGLATLEVYKLWRTHNMPGIIGFYYPDEYVKIVSGRSVPFFWYTPDAMFASLKPKRIVFPKHDRNDWARLLPFPSTDLGSVRLTKIFMRGLRDVAPFLGKFVDRFEVTFNSMMEMLNDFLLDFNVTRAACNWLLSNQHTNVWKQMLPDPTDCSQGQGLTEQADNSTACLPCAAGKFSLRSPQDNNLYCQDCLPGQYQNVLGTSECVSCSPGFFQDSMGQSQCKPCAKQFYSDIEGSTECLQCPLGTDTLESRTSSVEGCQCAEGTRLTSDGACSPCPQGMECLWGTTDFDFSGISGWNASMPRVRFGYWSDPSRPLSIFKCPDLDLDTEVCIGGAPGSCIEGGRFGFLCMSCPEGYTESSTACGKCSVFNRVFIPTLMAVVSVWLVITYYTGNSELLVNATVDLVMTVVLGMVVTMFQLLGMFNYLSIPWSKTDDAETVTSSGEPFIGGLEHFGMKCVFGSNPLTSFLAMVLIPFTIAFFLCACYFASRVVAFCCCRSQCCSVSPWEFAKVVNTLGNAYTALFITLATVSASPAQLYQHPNGKWGVQRYPEVLYGEEDYWAMTVMSLVAILLFVVPYIALCIWGVREAAGHVPSLGHDHWYKMTLELAQGSKAHVMFQYMLYRFRSGCWWWGNVVLLRQLLLSLAPSLPTNEPHAQALYVSCVLAFYAVLLSRFFPWKSDLLNILDLVQCLGLFVFIVFATSLMEPSSAKVYEVIMLCAVGSMVLLQLYAVIVACVTRVFHGQWGGVEKLLMSQGPPKDLPQLWYEVCRICSELPLVNVEMLMTRMTCHDWRSIADSTGAWHALAPNIFPAGNATRHRLIGLEHSNRFRDGKTTCQLVKETARCLPTHSQATTLSSSEPLSENPGESSSVNMSQSLCNTASVSSAPTGFTESRAFVAPQLFEADFAPIGPPPSSKVNLMTM